MNNPLWLELRNADLTASDLLRRFSIGNPPTPIVELATAMGIEVWFADMTDDGALRLDLENKEATIYIPEGAPEHRIRFTVAHELGHVMLHTFEEVMHRDVKGVPLTSTEYEANQFAVDLLLPEWMVRFAAREFGTAPVRLASLFQVSESTMGIRLRALGF